MIFNIRMQITERMRVRHWVKATMLPPLLVLHQAKCRPYL